MKIWRRISLRLRALFASRAVRREIEDEFDFHIEQRVAELIRAGESAASARRRAALQFGSRAGLMEAAYDVRGGEWWETVSADFTYSARRLRRSPAFAIPALLILVFGIGANVILF